eukprot:Gb_18836 [translate_table: standard]
MTKNRKLSNIMIEKCVKVEEEASVYEMMRLRNLNVFLYQEISRLRTENKSLKNRMVSIESIARKEPNANQKSKYKPQGISSWKSWNGPYYGRVPKAEEIRRQHQDQKEREYTDTYVPPHIEVITLEGVLVKVDPLTDAQVSQEDGARGWLQCEDENT